MNTKNLQIQTILNIVQRYPQGVSIAELLIELPKPIPRRTLQRRLANLAQQEKIVAVGKARATVYQPVHPQIIDRRYHLEEPAIQYQTPFPPHQAWRLKPCQRSHL